MSTSARPPNTARPPARLRSRPGVSASGRSDERALSQALGRHRAAWQASRCTAAQKYVFVLKRSGGKMRISNASIPLAFTSQRGSDENIDCCCAVFGSGLLARLGGDDGMHE